MRSKFLVCAAIAAAGMSAWFGPVAHAASSKRAAAAQKSRDQKEQKEKDAKSSELRADDKSMSKQLQWEDKVMGPDSKRAELDKIARAHAITEKAEKDKKDKDKQAALEAVAPAPRPEKAKKAEVALPSMSDEKSSAKSSSDEGRTHEISPKLETAAAQAPVPASKPADDKFIDKLLREEDAPSKKRASANDKELESLLAGAKDKPAAGHKRADSVDSLLKNADKGPAMPAPRAQSGLPEWAKQPEIASSAAPPPQPVALRTTAPRNDGVIHVVQGAAVASAAPARPAPTTHGARRGAKATASPVEWNDPFAEKKSPSFATAEPRKAAASHPSALPSGSASSGTSSSGVASGSWNDPFADGAETRKTTTRRAAPASSPAPAPTPARRNDKANESTHAPGQTGWKDPFTKAPTEPTHTPVAMRELGKNESSKWEIATHHGSSSTSSASSSHPGSDAHTSGGWGVIKKRAR